MKRALLEQLVAAQESNSQAVLVRSLNGQQQFLLDRDSEAPASASKKLLIEAERLVREF